ncbi:MAG: hypothetical protein ACLFRG_16530 [Desulfococcaceae bacterium]
MKRIAPKNFPNPAVEFFPDGVGVDLGHHSPHQMDQVGLGGKPEPGGFLVVQIGRFGGEFLPGVVDEADVRSGR